MAKATDAIDLDLLLREDLHRRRLHLHDIIDLVAGHSWWVSPAVYRSIHVVYPKTIRKTGKQKRGDVDKKGNMLWDNQPAQHAFLLALGTRYQKVRNLTVCHIYGDGVHDNKHFTNLANLTGFPKALSSCSEWEPIQAVLKYRSFRLFQYKGPNNLLPAKPEHYPKEKVWQHPQELDPAQLREITCDLRRQRKMRPQYRRRQ